MKSGTTTTYEPIERPSISLANSVATASLTLKKKASFYDNKLVAFEYVISLIANKSRFDTFTISLDSEEVLKLATAINGIRKKSNLLKTITIASRNDGKNFTIKTLERDLMAGADAEIAQAYFNLTKNHYFYLKLDGHAISVLYAKCIELLCLSNSCRPQDLFVYYPSLQRKSQRG